MAPANGPLILWLTKWPIYFLGHDQLLIFECIIMAFQILVPQLFTRFTPHRGNNIKSQPPPNFLPRETACLNHFFGIL